MKRQLGLNAIRAIRNGIVLFAFAMLVHATQFVVLTPEVPR